ncbi:MazG nucleotide pyrophosphohydrolase domain-containing protein [Nesterenkonia sp. HG001]|uniref:MazG nucleotide pyrophosphohydrolase domain-containing protein n=1 Tax=Nesterenkonia sp. HG001 TaxID=2983207 RepID=UPI002AC71ED6|nr:MazG nucleotide pyrophosphohydrolase domain-containing protein [Nesterenkonia sp. HG001]MDZ5076881.1 nucleotide pyrophosphohydrolase [Nesterenkonia sp. HG001]
MTHDSLVEYLVEEAYETVEEIESSRLGETLRKELGDLFFQIVLHAQLASERASFDLDGVAEAITAKLVRRSPHVFDDAGELDVDAEASLEEIERAWTRIKATEKAAENAAAKVAEDAADRVGETAGDANGTSPPRGEGAAELSAVVGSLPAHLPALARAAKLIDRLDRTLPPGAVGEPDAGPGHFSTGHDPLVAADEDALGELLFSVVHRARSRGQDPERALRRHLSTLAQGRVGPGVSR